jgi:hypothetical protein
VHCGDPRLGVFITHTHRHNGKLNRKKGVAGLREVASRSSVCLIIMLGSLVGLLQRFGSKLGLRAFLREMRVMSLMTCDDMMMGANRTFRSPAPCSERLHPAATTKHLFRKAR